MMVDIRFSYFRSFDMVIVTGVNEFKKKLTLYFNRTRLPNSYLLAFII